MRGAVLKTSADRLLTSHVASCARPTFNPVRLNLLRFMLMLLRCTSTAWLQIILPAVRSAVSQSPKYFDILLYAFCVYAHFPTRIYDGYMLLVLLFNNIFLIHRQRNRSNSTRIPTIRSGVTCAFCVTAAERTTSMWRSGNGSKSWVSEKPMTFQASRCYGHQM